MWVTQQGIYEELTCNRTYSIAALISKTGKNTRRRGAWKIRKRCQGSGSRAKYVAAKGVHEDRLETGGAGKEFSTNTEIQRLREWFSGMVNGNLSH